MAKNIKSQKYLDFGKGLNLFTRDTMINENESSVAYNIWATGKNSIKKRPGVMKLGVIAGGNPIDGLGSYYNASTRKLLAMCGGALVDITSGTAVALSAVPASAGTFTSGKRADFCQAGGNLYVANGTEKIRYFDGTTIRESAGTIIGKYMIFYKNCLWATGEPTAGNETRLYRSGNDTSIGNFTYDVTTNPLATSIYISKSDGQYVTGFFKHQDYLYLTKERSLWRETVGTDTYQLITTELIDPARGCDSHHSIDSVDNDNFMFQEQGVFATGYEPNILDQIRTNVVSLRIDPDLKAIQKSRLANVEGIYYDNHYYMSYTSGGGTVNDVMKVYDRQRLGWWEFQIAINGVFTGANCFAEFKDSTGQTRLYFGSPVDGSIYYFDDTIKSDQGNYNVVTVDQSFIPASIVYSGSRFGDVGYGKVAQPFIPTQAGLIKVVWQKGGNVGTGLSAGVTISIQSDNAGDPSGTPLVSKTYTVAEWNALPTSTDIVENSLTYTLTPSSKYWIVWETTSSDASNYANIANGDGAGTMLFKKWNGAAWAVFYNYYGLYFKTYYNLPTEGAFAIFTDLKTSKFSFGDYAQMKFFLDCEIYFGKTPGNPTINVYVDNTLAASRTIQLGAQGSAGIGQGKIGVEKIGVGSGSLDVNDTGGGDFVRIPLGVSGRNVQIEITDEDLTGQKSWELNALHFNFKPLSNLYQPGTK